MATVDYIQIVEYALLRFVLFPNNQFLFRNPDFPSRVMLKFTHLPLTLTMRCMRTFTRAPFMAIRLDLDMLATTLTPFLHKYIQKLK